MYQVSSTYVSEIKNPIRNPSYIKINFKVTDPQAIADSSIADNGHLYFSDKDNIVIVDGVTQNYFTLEHNRGILNGNFRLPIPDGQTQIYQGFVGDLVSDDNGHWTTNPTLTVSFLTEHFIFAGLSFSFDTVLGDFPKQFTIKAYDNNVLVQTVDLIPTGSTYVCDTAIVQCNKLELIAIQSNIPHRRFRMEEFTLGIKQIFTDENLDKASWKRSIDLVGSKLPTDTFDFTLIDVEKKYDPENVTGIYKYIEEKQEAKISIGYELDNGSIEWQPIGTLFTTGELKVDTKSVIPMVNFKTTSLLSQMIEEYGNGVYSSGGTTLYDLATAVLTYSNLPLDSTGANRWILDDSLKNYTTKMPLPVKKCNALLQLIANAGMCVLSTTRDGFIKIAPKNDSVNDFTFNIADMYGVASPSKYPVLQGVDTIYNTISIASTATQLASATISGASSTEYEIKYNKATEIIASAGTGLTIIGTPVYYATKCKIVLTGSGTLTINGKLLTITETGISVEFNPTATDRCPIKNELIMSQSHAILYGTWIGNYTNRRTEYSFQNRGFPEIDCTDYLYIDTIYNTGIEVDVISTEIEYEGSISGKTKVLVR